LGLASLTSCDGVVKEKFLDDVYQGLVDAISEEVPGLLPGAPASPGGGMPDIG